MTYLRTGLKYTTLSLTALAMASPVFGQDEAFGRQGTFSFSQGAKLNLDRGLSTTTDLGLSFQTRTRAQSLTFNLGTQIHGDFTDNGDDDFEARNVNGSLRYNRRGANSSLSFGIGYRETFLGDEVITLADDPFFGIGFGNDVLIIDNGTRTAQSANIRYRFGIEGPFGLTIAARHSDFDYQDTVDPDLIDSTVQSYDLTGEFRLSPVTSLRALYGNSVAEDEDAGQTTRENTYFGLGAETQTASGLSIRGDVLFDESETRTNSPSSTLNDGVGIELEFSQPRPAGSIGALLTSRIDESGRRTTATVNRSFEFPDGGLAFAVGVVDQEGADSLQVVGDIDYRKETRDGGFTANIGQSAGTSQGVPVLSTSVELGYEQAINAASSWQAEIGYFATDDIVGVEDGNRTIATFTYTRALTRDWNMNTGFERRKSDGGSANNSVFFNIEREVTFGF